MNVFNVSIIIPHYNSLELLEKLIQSIPKQDDIQVIVVDDMSDEKLNVNKFLKQHYKHVLFASNETGHKGAGVCRNIGLGLANGKWILFADADDYFVVGFYEKIKKYFSSDYDIDVIFFTPVSIDLKTGDSSLRHKLYERLILDYINKKDLKSELELRYNFFVPWSKLIRHDFIINNKILFDNTIAANDVMFSIKTGYWACKFEVTKEIIYCVTARANSLTTTISEKIFDARLEVYINYCNFINENLTCEEKKYLKVNGRYFVINAIIHKLGWKKAFSTFIKLRKNNVNVNFISFRSYNPINILKKIIAFYKNYKNTKKYWVYNNQHKEDK